MSDVEPNLEPQPEEPPILNADADFVRSVPIAVREAFDGIAAKVFLREGVTFYRFLERDFTGAAEGFWLPAETYSEIRNQSLLHGVPIPDWAVTQSTLLPRPPLPVMFCQVTLVQRVYAFRGLLKHPGAARQLRLWIPGLTWEHVIVRCYNL